jgi:N-acetylglucosaminyl-diphospho-decaprenol L-rhamnosyltransferase
VAAREAQDGPPTTLTVIVVSWNTRTLLDRCLSALAASMLASQTDVWVVDNHSSDGSAELVARDHPGVRLIALETNLGYGPAINLAAAGVRSPYLVIANADTAVAPGALAALHAAAEADPGAGIVAPRLVLPDGSTQHLAWAFPTVRATLAQNLGPRLLPGEIGDRLALRGAWNPDRPRRVPWAVGALLLIRRSAWEQVGGFDPEQWMSAEDLDLGWRMARAGWATRYEPRAIVQHAESSATRQVWGDDLAIHWQRCAYAWMVRRMGRRRTAAVGLLNLAGSAARLLSDWIIAGLRVDDRLRAAGRWTAVHVYALAPQRTLRRFR